MADCKFENVPLTNDGVKIIVNSVCSDGQVCDMCLEDITSEDDSVKITRTDSEPDPETGFFSSSFDLSVSGGGGETNNYDSVFVNSATWVPTELNSIMEKLQSRPIVIAGNGLTSIDSDLTGTEVIIGIIYRSGTNTYSIVGIQYSVKYGTRTLEYRYSNSAWAKQVEPDLSSYINVTDINWVPNIQNENDFPIGATKMIYFSPSANSVTGTNKSIYGIIQRQLLNQFILFGFIADEQITDNYYPISAWWTPNEWRESKISVNATWETLEGKPFKTIGTGLSVDTNNALNVNATSIQLTTNSNDPITTLTADQFPIGTQKTIFMGAVFLINMLSISSNYATGVIHKITNNNYYVSFTTNNDLSKDRMDVYSGNLQNGFWNISKLSDNIEPTVTRAEYEALLTRVEALEGGS